MGLNLHLVICTHLCVGVYIFFRIILVVQKDLHVSLNKKLELICAEVIIAFLCLVCLGEKYFTGK